MKYNPDSSFYKMATTMIQFIFLNVLFILSCLPLITIGASFSALFYATMSFAEDENTDLLKAFVSSWRHNWKKGTCLAALFSMSSAILIFGIFFWLNFQTIIGSILSLVAIVVLLYLVIATLISFALVSRFDSPIRQLIKNALLIPFVSPIRAFGILIILVTALCCVLLFPMFKSLLLIFGFAFITYGISFLLLAIFKQIDA